VRLVMCHALSLLKPKASWRRDPPGRLAISPG
jgi:hypothetical protein